MPEPGATGSGVGAGMAGGGIGAGDVEGPGGINEGPDVFGGYDLNADTDLAGALADALASANVDDFGAYAVQDQQSQDELSAGERERMAQAAAQAAYDDVIGSSTGIAQANIAALGGFQDQSGPPGYEAPGVGTGVEDFSSGGYATAPATSDLSFGAYGQQTQPSGDVLSPGEQGRVDAGGYQDVLGSNTGLAQANIANLGGFASPTAAGTPGYAQPGSAWGQGQVEDFANMPMAESFTSPAQPEGALSASQPGMISAGTTGPHVTEGTINQINPADYTGVIRGGFTVPGTYTDDYLAGTPAGTTAPGTDFFGDEDVGTAAASPAGTRLQGAEFHAVAKSQIDNAIMSLSEKFDYEAKVAKEKYGMRSQKYQKAQDLANTYKALDMYSKAYGATQGGSFLGNLLSGVMPLGAALQGIQGWLTKQGIYSKIDTKELEEKLRAASKAGTLDQLMRDLNQSGEGGMAVEMALQEEVSSFIQRYPWAAELDPKYIKYLIDNPAELQDLLGENEGG